jgi:hypothetical protein
MRRHLLGLALASLAPVAAAGAATGDVVVVAKPAFPPPLTSLTPRSGQRLTVVSTAPRSPTYTAPRATRPPDGAPRVLRGQGRTRVFGRPGTTFVVYGTSVIAAFGPKGRLKYAFELRSFEFPPGTVAPGAYGPQEVFWAQQVGRLLVVQTAHLGYARDSAGRNGYLTGIDLDTGRVTWRSPSLVANAGNFVVVNGMIVSGYGFTSERDWLYLVDARTGRIRDRVAIPSMAETLAWSRKRVLVRAYDARVVVRLDVLFD